jgi:hypothetical protein
MAINNPVSLLPNEPRRTTPPAPGWTPEARHNAPGEIPHLIGEGGEILTGTGAAVGGSGVGYSGSTGGSNPMESPGGDGLIDIPKALAAGLITEEQAEALWGAYLQLLNVYEGSEFSLGLDLATMVAPIQQMLGTNPTAAIGQLNVLISQVQSLIDQSQDRLEYESTEAHRAFQRDFETTREERLGRGQAAEIEQWGIRNRFSQAELEAENRRAELGALETAARTRADLAASALSARSSLSGALFGRAGGFPYPGPAGYSPSGSGLAALVAQSGGMATDPYSFTGGATAFPHLTSGPEYRLAQQLVNELAGTRLDTPVVVPIDAGIE